MEFRKEPLLNIISEIIDYRGKTPKKLGGSWSDSGYRAFSAKNIKTGKIVQPGAIRFVDTDMYKKWMKTEVEKGTIIITSEAPFGEILYWDSDEKIVLSQRLFGLKIKPSFNSKYIYYYMISSGFQDELSARATGSTVTGLRQPQLLNCVVEYPSYENQNKIEKILSSIDKKIELNNNINGNLQKLSQELFKKWFIDFDFPNEDGKPYKSSGGKMIESNFDKIPEGWEISKLKKILKRKNNKISNYESWKNLQLIDLSVMPQFDICLGEFNSASTMISNIYKLEKKDILYGSIRPYFGKAGVSPIDGAVTGTVFCYDSKITTHYEFLLLMTTSNKFIDYTIRLSKGTKMPIISWHDFIEYKFPMPNEEVLESFSYKISPLINEIINNMLINNQLKMMRDLLLPKLMNGDIDLENINV